MPRSAASYTAKKPAKKTKTTATRRTATAKKTAAPRKTTARKTTSKAAAGLEDQVAQKAYELFERRGYRHGFDQFDWKLADQLVKLETQRSKLKTKKRINFDAQENGTKERIAKKAYELFEQTGYAHGTHDFNWYLAEILVQLEG